MRLRTPAEVKARVSGERVLAWAPSDGSTVVATDDALWLPPGPVPGPERVPWDLVLRVSWQPGRFELVSQERPGARADTRQVPVADVGSLPGVIKERVNASIVVARQVALDGDRGARIVARRTPGSTELRWSVVFDPGLDPRDPELRAAADEALAALRGSLGV
jgi:hypothetical protein